jgi:hypothetical protein
MNPFEKDTFYTNFTDLNTVGTWGSLKGKFYPNNTSDELSNAINEVQEYVDNILKENRAKLQTFSANERKDLKVLDGSGMYIGDDTQDRAIEHVRAYLTSPLASWNQVGRNHLNTWYPNARDVLTNYDKGVEVLKDLKDKYKTAKDKEDRERKALELKEQQKTNQSQQEALTKQQETIATATEAKKVQTKQDIKKYAVIGLIAIVGIVVFYKVVKK